LRVQTCFLRIRNVPKKKGARKQVWNVESAALLFVGISLLDHCMEEGKDIHQRPEAFMGASAESIRFPKGIPKGIPWDEALMSSQQASRSASEIFA